MADDPTDAAEARCRQLEDALRHVLAVLPAPVWNHKRVLVWSLLDQERIYQALSSALPAPLRARWPGRDTTPL